MDKDKEKSKAPPTSLSIRAKDKGNTGASHTQRSSTGITQEARLGSNNEPGHETNHHIHVPDRQNPSPAHSLPTRSSGAPESLTSTTRAAASGTPRRPSDTDSIELFPNPEHPHAHDIDKNLQEFKKYFDGDGDKLNGHCNGGA